MKREKAKSIVYVVKKGDCLSTIASRYGVGVNDIKRWNSLQGNLVRVGQKLTIYPGGEGGEKVIVHTIKRGETLWKIASIYGLSIDDIIETNQGIEPEKLKVGEEITLRLNQ